MTYDDIVSIFLTAPATPIPAPELPTTPARRLRDALEPIATQGWWSRPPNERLAALGLGFFDGYVWGRAAALGEPAAPVVVATFGVFEPGLLMAVYDQARSTASRDDVLAAREQGAVESLVSLVSDADAAAIADPLLDALAALDGMGRPLFSALRGLPLPVSPHGRLWRSAELVREHRGDGHLATCVAAGLDAVTSNVLTELWLGYDLGAYSGTRGFAGEQLATTLAMLEAGGWVADGALTDAGRTRRLSIEQQTDATQEQLVTRLGSAIDAVTAAAAVISEQILASGSFPPDPRKRAGG